MTWEQAYEILKPIPTDDLTVRCVKASQLLKSANAEYFKPVIKLLLSKEKGERHTHRKGKRVVMLAHVKGKSGKFFVDTEFLNRATEIAER